MAQNTVIRKTSNTQNIINRLQSKSVFVGLPKDSDAYPDGTSVIEVGADHEFGSDGPRTYTSQARTLKSGKKVSGGNTITVSGVPERSFLRSTAKDKRKEWTGLIVKQMKSVLTEKITTDDALEKVGLRAETDVKKKIVEISDPPNSPQVIKDKGSSNPLIDTGHLLGAITHVVR